MKMTLVQRAATYPGRCAAMPWLRPEHSGGYIDTGSDMPSGGRDGHVYVSVVAAQQMARLLGWVAPAQTKAMEARFAEGQVRIAELEAQLEEANQLADAFDVVKRRKARTKEAV